MENLIKNPKYDSVVDGFSAIGDKINEIIDWINQHEKEYSLDKQEPKHEHKSSRTSWADISVRRCDDCPALNFGSDNHLEWYIPEK